MANAFEWSVDPTSIGLALQRARLVDLRPAWREVANVIASDQRSTFASRGGNIGETWPALSAEAMARKARSSGGSADLVLNGELLAQVGSATAGVRSATATFLKFGSNLKHGAVQHYGSPARGIPARPFMRLSDGAQAQIKAIIARAVEAEVARLAALIQGGA